MLHKMPHHDRRTEHRLSCNKLVSPQCGEAAGNVIRSRIDQLTAAVGGLSALLRCLLAF